MHSVPDDGATLIYRECIDVANWTVGVRKLTEMASHAKMNSEDKTGKDTNGVVGRHSA